MLFNENIGNTIDTELTISDGNAVYRYDAFANTLTEVSQTARLVLQPYESVVFLQGEESQVKAIAENWRLVSLENLIEKVARSHLAQMVKWKTEPICFRKNGK